MSLLQLPPEILEDIFHYVGSSFFHEDLMRLTISKRWLDFALPTFFKTISLSQNSLRVWSSLQGSNMQSSITHTLKSVESLDLHFSLYEGRVFIHSLGNYSLVSQALETAIHRTASMYHPNETWVDVLEHDITRLATTTQKCRNLHTLRIDAHRATVPTITGRYFDYISVPAMRNLLRMDSLNTLVLDMPCRFLTLPREWWGGYPHMCSTINTLLNSLSVLHIRLDTICPNILRPRDPNGTLKLRELVVNLSMIQKESGVVWVGHSTPCNPLHMGMRQLRTDIKRQARALVERMESPKLVRILTHSNPEMELHSLDILTGQTMFLRHIMPWDADGDIVESTESDSEFGSEFDDDMESEDTDDDHIVSDE